MGRHREAQSKLFRSYGSFAVAGLGGIANLVPAFLLWSGELLVPKVRRGVQIPKDQAWPPGYMVRLPWKRWNYERH
jgi:hypothetical protein